jgi:hypothetical protein
VREATGPGGEPNAAIGVASPSTRVVKLALGALWAVDDEVVAPHPQAIAAPPTLIVGQPDTSAFFAPQNQCAGFGAHAQSLGTSLRYLVAERSDLAWTKPRQRRKAYRGAADYEPQSALSITISVGVSLTAVGRTPTTRSAPPGPSGITSPGRHIGATVWNDGGSAGVPSVVSRLKVNAHRSSLSRLGPDGDSRILRPGRLLGGGEIAPPLGLAELPFGARVVTATREPHGVPHGRRVLQLV